jgi:hypothetical protein
MPENVMRRSAEESKDGSSMQRFAHEQVTTVTLCRSQSNHFKGLSGT